MPLKPGKLWIVATPLGNYDDISERAKYLLKSADLVYAEDTRCAAKLIANCALSARQINSYFEHNEEDRQQEILKALTEGKEVVLISDAGTPLLADPGYTLVRACRKAGFQVSPVPGPFAPAAALSAAGLPPLPFTFLGFLPRGKKQREDTFRIFRQFPGSLIFFDRKDRLCESLEIAYSILNIRELAICREMTKTHEEFIVGRLEDYQRLCANLLGELTIIIGPPEIISRTPEEKIREMIKQHKIDNLKPREIITKIKPECEGWTSRELYNLISEHEN